MNSTVFFERLLSQQLCFIVSPVSKKELYFSVANQLILIKILTAKNWGHSDMFIASFPNKHQNSQR